MSTRAMKVKSTLESLDAATAAKFERLALDAVALVRSCVALDDAYFDSVIGASADLEFERHSQDELPTVKSIGR